MKLTSLLKAISCLFLKLWIHPLLARKCVWPKLTANSWAFSLTIRPPTRTFLSLHDRIHSKINSSTSQNSRGLSRLLVFKRPFDSRYFSLFFNIVVKVVAGIPNSFAIRHFFLVGFSSIAFKRLRLNSTVSELHLRGFRSAIPNCRTARARALSETDSSTGSVRGNWHVSGFPAVTRVYKFHHFGLSRSQSQHCDSSYRLTLRIRQLQAAQCTLPKQNFPL